MSQPGMRWEPWTRASLASPAFACLGAGLLVVLDEARKRFGCGCEVAVVGFAFIFDLLVVVSLVAEPWTRASFASPTFACLCSGLLVVLDEALTRAFRLLWL